MLEKTPAGRGLGHCAALAVVLVVASAPALARADAAPSASELQAARSLFTSAERDEDAGRWAEALEKLRKVGSVKLTAGVKFHIALCEENLGHLTVALAEYTAAEAMATREKNKEVLESLKAPLAALKERVPELTINVPEGATGAEVSLDGRTLAPGVYGVGMPVDPGAHRVEAKAPGRVPFATDVTLAERDNGTVDVSLPVPPPLKSVAVAPASVAPRAMSAEDLPPADHSGTGGQRSRVPAILATTGAVALAAGGVAFFLSARTTHDHVVALCGSSGSDCGDDLKTGTRTLDALAAGAWLGAGAATVLAVVLWTKPSQKPTAAQAAASAIRIGPGSLGVAGEF